MKPRARNNDIAMDACFADFRVLPRLTAEESREYFLRSALERDEVDFNRLILGNMGLVVCIARRCSYHWPV